MKKRVIFVTLFLTIFLFISCSNEEVDEIGNQENIGNNDDNLVIDITKEKDESISNLDMKVVELIEELDDENKYFFDEQILTNDEIILLVDETSGLKLTENELVSIDFNINSGISKKTKIGYFLDGYFTEVPYKLEDNKLNASIEVPKDGDYTICIMNTNKGSTTITNGNIIIK